MTSLAGRVVTAQVLFVRFYSRDVHTMGCLSEGSLLGYGCILLLPVGALVRNENVNKLLVLFAGRVFLPGAIWCP